jgi:ABC-type multidrug transport system ATPase subunit/peptidoglycan/LPS O-acetylase OafA/YrhL
MVKHTQERNHALDAVRACALLSGIVLHATMTFMPGLAAFGFPADSSQSPALQVVFYVIHIFRMALFFMIAGYFAHLMFHHKGMLGLLGDRAKRILVPLLVGWVFFGPPVMALIYIGLAPSLDAAPPAPAGFPLAHLWFLYYLLLIYGVTLVARDCFMRLDRQGALRARLDGVMRSLVRGHSAPLLLAAPIAGCLYLAPGWNLWGGIPSPDTGLTPQSPAMIGFGTAFIFGWLLHRQSELLAVWKRRWTLHLTLAAVFSALSLWIVGRLPNPLEAPPWIKLGYAACYTLAIWHWIFGITGAALRFCSRANTGLRYLADSSYWLYLAHLPVVFALQMTMLDWNLHWSVKFPLIVGTALSILLLSYHYCVRNTWIGEILNGRTFKRTPTVPNAIRTEAQVADDAGVIAQLSGVRKRYGSTTALDGLDLEIRAGELLALLGPNGAGKSTAISCLLGLQDPDSGTVRLFGEPPQCMASRRRVGAMLQNVDLPPELHVRELIELSRSYYANPLPIDEVLRLTFTAPIAHRSYARLSGGQKRLVQFAIALCGRPQLLFLDEPTVGLDLEARRMLWTTLRALVDAGCSIVLTTHYLEEAEALADRVAVVAKGRLVALGSVPEIRERVSHTRMSCITRLDAGEAGRWPGVISARREGSRLTLIVTDPDKVARHLFQDDPHFSELQIERPGLAEAFTDITQEAA